MLNSMLLKPAIIILTVMSTVSGGMYFVKSQGADIMPIRYVRVEGVFQYMSREKIRSAINEQVMFGFFNVNLQHLRNAVSRLPWSDQVTVKRIWPDAIKVAVSEQHPVARWSDKKLINDDGEVFSPENMSEFNYLPLIHAPEGQQKKYLEIWKGLQLALQDENLVLSGLFVDDRLAWQLRLENDQTILLGREDQLKKMQRFLSTLDVLGDEIVQRMRVVDLRYPNGYAVAWKNGVEVIDWQQKMAELAAHKSKAVVKRPNNENRLINNG